MASDREDAVKIWTEVIDEVLRIAPVAIREEIVTAVVKNNEQWVADRKKHGTVRVYTAAEFMKDDWDKAPATMYWHEINEAISLVIQVLVRSITNDNSPEDAAKILFREHRQGTGGRWLPDYLNNLPAITVNLKEATELADANEKSGLWFGD